MKRFLSFYIIACLFSWVTWLPLYLPHFGINLPFSIPYNHALGGLGPLLAALLLRIKEHGRIGLTDLFYKITAYRPRRYLLIALFGPFVLLVVASGVQALQTGHFPDWSSFGRTKEFPHFSFLTFFSLQPLFLWLWRRSGMGRLCGAGFAKKDVAPCNSRSFYSFLGTMALTAFPVPARLYQHGYGQHSRVDIQPAHRPYSAPLAANQVTQQYPYSGCLSCYG